MSLPHVLLGMLSRPASGYDLGQEFQKAIRHFWSAELAQIYPTLARLERDGLLESERAPSEKGPPRKVYRRTEAGREALVDWLLQGPIVRSERMPYLTQVFFLGEAPLPESIGFFEALRDDFQAHHEELAAIEAGWKAEDPRYPDALPLDEMHRQMTLVLGIRKYRLIAEWADECAQRLRARAPQSQD